MAETSDIASDSAEKAYAAAADEAKPFATEPAKAETVKSEPTPAAESVAAKAPVTTAAPKRAPAKRRSSAKSIRKPAAKAKSAAQKSTPVQKAAKAASRPGKPTPKIIQRKENIMATAKTPDFSKPFADAMSDIQTKAKSAYEKSTAVAGEMTDFAKGNVEAMVESGKVLSSGMQDIGKTYVTDAKSAYETMTADLKEMAAVKSPTELFQLQGKIARRNIESMVAFSSKSSDAMMKLYSEAFAPISGRVSLAAEKLSKVA